MARARACGVCVRVCACVCACVYVCVIIKMFITKKIINLFCKHPPSHITKLYMLHEVNSPVYYTTYSVEHNTMQLESMVDTCNRMHESMNLCQGVQA